MSLYLWLVLCSSLLPCSPGSLIQSPVLRCASRSPLGMTNGLIKNSQVSASSVYESRIEYEPSQARVGINSCWCSEERKSAPEKYVDDWLQVCFDKVTEVTGIATQGDPSFPPNYVKEYYLEYSTDSNSTVFTAFADGNSTRKVFIGNTDATGIVYNWFVESIRALCLRFRTLVLNRTDDKRHVCLRLEYFGCLDPVVASAVMPLGMQSGIISNDQLSGEGSNPHLARLFTPGEGLYRNANTMFLLIDLKMLLVVTAVATQGSPTRYSYSLGRVTAFDLFLGKRKDSLFKINEKAYIANEKTSKDPVMNMVSSQGPAQFVKIQMVTGFAASNYYYLKVEIYGRNAACSEDLVYQSLNDDQREIRNVTYAEVDGNTAWCMTRGQELTVILEEPQVVSGLALQGSSEADAWVNRYSLFFYDVEGRKQFFSDFQGATSRITPLSVNWFSQLTITDKVVLKPTDCNRLCCLRFALKGCTKALSEPQDLTCDQASEGRYLRWKAPAIMPAGVESYTVVVSATQPFEPLLSSHRNYSVAGSGNLEQWIELGLPAAKYVAWVVASHHKIRKMSQPCSFLSQPKAPARVSPNISSGFDGLTSYRSMRWSKVSEYNGPISYYEVVVSTIREFDLNTANRSLLVDQKLAWKMGLKFFVAAKVSATGGSSGAVIDATFVEGEEQARGIEAVLPVFGTVYVHSRAVSDGKDLKNYGFDDVDLLGEVHTYVLERKSLKKLESSEKVTLNRSYAILLSMGPANTKYYQIIVRKFNASSSAPKAAFDYSELDFKTYDTAAVGDVYVAAEFEAWVNDSVRVFVIGDGKLYSKGNVSRVRRSSDRMVHFNGPLEVNASYTAFQRAVTATGEVFSSPWIAEFKGPPALPFVEPVPVPKGGSIASVVGSAVGGSVVALLLILLAAVLLIRKGVFARCVVKYDGAEKEHPLVLVNGNKSKSPVPPADGTESLHSDLLQDDGHVVSDGDCIYYNTAAAGKSSGTWVKLMDLPAYYHVNERNDFAGFKEQFESISLDQQHPWLEGEKAGKEKNRYLNIAAYDHSRVKLSVKSGAGKSASDYINANYIPGFDRDAVYIATQAPKSETVPDFWQMVLDQKPDAVIMLTNLVEEGKTKCEQYWPSLSSQSFRGIEVEVVACDQYSDYVIRKMRVGQVDASERHHLIHYHFTSWPDHGCPEHATMLLNFCRRFRSSHPYGRCKSPVVVHCSAGVGRTGAFILIDAMMEMMRQTNAIDIYHYFAKIRNSRVKMVQNLDQYVLAYKAVLEAVSCGYTEIDASAVATEYRKLIAGLGSADTKAKLEEQFERLNAVTPRFGISKYQAGMLPKNAAKNRFAQILPRDENRVVLRDYSTDYVNAVYVDGFKAKGALIASQEPLPGTVCDFWHMIGQCQVTTVVTLQGDDEDITPYWPEPPTSTNFGNVAVQCVSKDAENAIVTRKLVLTNIQEQNNVDVDHHFIAWPSAEPPSASLVLALVRLIERSQQALGNGRVVVLCSNGACRSGTLIACINVLERLKIEQLVDVFQAVKRIRLSRPEFVGDARQYQLIYEVALRYLDSFATYSNFN